MSLSHEQFAAVFNSLLPLLFIVSAKHKFVLVLGCFKFNVPNLQMSNLKCFGVIILNNSQNLFAIRT